MSRQVAGMFFGFLAAALPSAPAHGAPTAPVQVAAGPNHPPVWDDEPVATGTDRVSTGGYYSLTIRAHDADFDPITFTVSQLPIGANVHWTLQELRDDGNSVRASFYCPDITWTPTDSQTGEHEFTITATDGKATITRTQRVIVEEEWETFLMPGAAYSMWMPVATDELGIFHGPLAELLLAGWIHRTENRGPSHVRIYLDLGLIGSTKRHLSKAVQTSLGFDLSFERNPTRRYLIPYFGLEGGYFFQTQIDEAAWLVPFLGIRAWGDRNLFVNLNGGYLFPTEQVDRFRGYYARLAIDASLW